MSQTAMTKDQISAAIAEKAFRDEGFRQRILADADAVYAQETGQALPAGVHVKVHEDDAHTVNFAIPAKPANAGELSDSELEQVAGGTSPLVIPLMLSAGGSLAAIFTTRMNISHHKGW